MIVISNKVQKNANSNRIFHDFSNFCLKFPGLPITNMPSSFSCSVSFNYNPTCRWSCPTNVRIESDRTESSAHICFIKVTVF